MLGAPDGAARALSRDVLLALATRVLGMVAALLLYLVLARTLPMAEFGYYALALAWLNVLAMVASLGTDNATLRFLPGYRVRGERARFDAFVARVPRLVLGVGIPLTLVAGVVAWWRLPPERAWASVTLLAAIVPIAFIAQRQALLRVYGRIVWAILPEQVLRPLFAAVLLLLATASWLPPTALTAAFAMLCATLLGYGLGAVVLAHARRRAPALVGDRADEQPDDTERSEWRNTALRLGLFSWSYALLRQLDVLLLGWLGDPAQTALYVIAARCADVVLFVSLAIDVLIAPRVAQTHAQGDRVALAALVRRAARLSVLLTLPAAVLLLLLARWLLPLFGDAYSAGSAVLALLVVGQALAVGCGYGSYLLTMTGRERTALGVLAVALATHAIVCVLAIPSLGILGAALGTVVGALTWRLGSAFAAYRALGVNALPLGPAVRT